MSYEDAGQYSGFGGSQLGGGGHFASPSQGTMNQYGNPGGSGSGMAKKRDPQSLTRLTIKQCNEAVEINGKYHIDNRPIQQVHLVANVLSVSPKETNVELNVEDGSGTITVRMYLEGNEGEGIQSIKEGEYRMIVGSLRKIGGQLCVVAFTVSLVEDHNMLTMHLLDTILTHLRATQGPPPNKQLGANGMGMGMGMGMSNGMGMNYGMKPENGSMQVDYGHAGGSIHGGGMGGGGSLKDQVLYCFQHGEGADTDSGCSIAKVASQLSSFTFLQIQEAVAELSNEGHLYSTIDEDHYKTTTS